ncbi:MAG: hypothetical protein ABIR96_02530, partial [Bdellovibrionota bacterium]
DTQIAKHGVESIAKESIAPPRLPEVKALEMKTPEMKAPEIVKAPEPKVAAAVPAPVVADRAASHEALSYSQLSPDELKAQGGLTGYAFRNALDYLGSSEKSLSEMRVLTSEQQALHAAKIKDLTTQMKAAQGPQKMEIMDELINLTGGESQYVNEFAQVINGLPGPNASKISHLRQLENLTSQQKAGLKKLEEMVAKGETAAPNIPAATPVAVPTIPTAATPAPASATRGLVASADQKKALAILDRPGVISKSDAVNVRANIATEILEANATAKGLPQPKAFTTAQKEAIQKSHEVGVRQANGRYSLADIREKRRILEAAGIDASTSRALFDAGIVGSVTDDVVQSGVTREMRAALSPVNGELASVSGSRGEIFQTSTRKLTDVKLNEGKNVVPGETINFDGRLGLESIEKRGQQLDTYFQRAKRDHDYLMGELQSESISPAREKAVKQELYDLESELKGLKEEVDFAAKGRTSHPGLAGSNGKSQLQKSGEKWKEFTDNVLQYPVGENSRKAPAALPKATEAKPTKSSIDFIPIEAVSDASNKGHVIVLDSPYASASAGRPENIKVVDHHGPYRNPSKPYQNTTSKIIDAYEVAEKQMGKGTAPEAVRDRMLKNLLGLDPAQPLPPNVSFSTDNFGDAAKAFNLVQHPERLADKQSRSFLRLATFHEDFGVFGTKTTAIAKANPKAKAAIDFSEAVMQVNDDVIATSRANPSMSGAFKGSDRFNGIDGQLQKDIMARSQTELDRVYSDAAYRAKKAAEFRGKVDIAAKAIEAQAVVKPGQGLLSNLESRVPAKDYKKFLEQVAVVDGSKIPPGGQFSNWGAVSAAHAKPYQIQTIPMGPKTGYIISIPQGRKNLGAINENVLKALKDAGAGNFMMRDSGLLFNFAGESLPPAQVLEILAREMGKSF